MQEINKFGIFCCVTNGVRATGMTPFKLFFVFLASVHIHRYPLILFHSILEMSMDLNSIDLLLCSFRHHIFATV